MDYARKKEMNNKETDKKRSLIRQEWNDRQTDSREERLYRVVSDENSIYEYDLSCMSEKRKPANEK